MLAFFPPIGCTNRLNLLAQVVEHHDVGIHVEEIVGVWRVVVFDPLLRLRAFVTEHVVAVFGLVIHAVEPRHLQGDGGKVHYYAPPDVEKSSTACLFVHLGVAKGRTYFRKTWIILCF